MPIDPWSRAALALPLWAGQKNGFLLWWSMSVNDVLVTPRSPVLAVDPTSKKFAASAALLRDATGALVGGSV